MEIKGVRGMHDLFGDEMASWTAVEEKVKKLLSSFGYEEIRTPALENMEVFKQTVGDETDIVTKQMFVIESHDAEKIVLRPEETASFMRAVIEHNLHKTRSQHRYFYYLPMFRHERPQKGRLRQFHQIGAELIHETAPEGDAEIIILLDSIFKDFNLVDYEIRINSVGCNQCRPSYNEKLRTFLKPKLSSLCEECQKRFERSPLRVLDCKKESCKAIAKNAPRIVDHLCDACKKHHNTLKERLTLLRVPFIDDAYIVRGLDYYCRTAFEFTSSLLGAQNALGGGGRYDGLSSRFAREEIPAVGFAMGVERFLIALEEKRLKPLPQKKPIFYFSPLGEKAFELLFPLSFALKQKGIWVEMSYDKEKRLKGQLKHADRLGCRYATLLGDTEIAQSQFLLKDMKAGTQETLPLARIEDELYRRATLAS